MTEKEPGEIRVTMVSGDELKLHDATVAGDSIVGVEEWSGGQWRSATIPMAVAVTDVASVDERQGQTGLSILAAIPLVIVSGMVIFVIGCVIWECDIY